MDILERVEDWHQAVIMMDIRNECYEYMTNNNKPIELREQFFWYKNVYKNSLDMTAYLYANSEAYIGYGIIKTDKNAEWLTGGLVSPVRGQGYGRSLFEALIAEARGHSYPYSDNIRLEVLYSNVKAINLYTSLGFEIVQQHNEIIEMVLT